MNIDEAYGLTMSVIQELEKAGISVDKIAPRSKNNPELVAKYNRIDCIKPEKWLHVTLYPKNILEGRIVNEKARYLGQLGIAFDMGGSCGFRDWEIDWSFRCSEIPDAEWDEARDTVEDIICNLPKDKED